MTEKQTNHQDTSTSTMSKDDQLSKDIAYTINHAIACTVVDWVGQTPALIAMQKAIGVENPKGVGCSNPFHDHKSGEHHGHNHSHSHDSHHHGHEHGHNCGHDHTPENHTKTDTNTHKKHIKTLAKTFSAAELVGDFAGIVPTVAMQKYMPWTMDAVRPLLSTTLGPVFRWGAENSTRKWAFENGIDRNSTEYKNHKDEIFEHEMHHLPQAAWWTAWSSAFNVGLQAPFYEKFATPEIREQFPIGDTKQRIKTKICGASLSIGLVLGTRALFPKTAHSFTDWTEDKIIKPTTKIATRTLGISDAIVDEASAEKQKYHRASISSSPNTTVDAANATIADRENEHLNVLVPEHLERS